MKGNVVMLSGDREISGVVVRQRTKDGYFNVVDIFKAVNKYRINASLSPLVFDNYLKNDRTREFIQTLVTSEHLDYPYTREKGRTHGSYCHPLIMVDIFMWGAPEFKVKVLKWLSDGLIASRTASADSFKTLNETLYGFYVDKTEFTEVVKHFSFKLKRTLGVDDWNKATKEQLDTRDRILTNANKLLGVTQEVETSLSLALKMEGVNNGSQ